MPQIQENNWKYGVDTKFDFHPSACVDMYAYIGKGTKIWHNTHVMNTGEIGKNCVIGQNCFIAGKVGNGCRIQNNVSVFDGVTLEDNIFVGPSVVFTNVKRPRAGRKAASYCETLVKEGATIGANATIICGVTIGRYAFIGAGSIVTKDVPDYAMVWGNPAKIQGWVCECGEPLFWTPDGAETDEAVCECGKKYSKHLLEVLRH